MRVRDHLLLSTGAALVAWPWLRREAVLPWTTSILIDVDHYLYYCWHDRRLSPAAALRFFGQAQPPRHAGTRLLHSPLALLVLLVSRRWRFTTLLALGILFHLGLDAYHEARTRNARRAALARDAFTCQQCGARDQTIVAHLHVQPALLPSYRLECYRSLCARCHEAAHQHPGEANGSIRIVEGG